MRLRSSSSAGFTLIELLVVLGIMGLILASAVMARPQNAAARVERTARSMAATFQLARSRAMTANTDIVVAIDPVNAEFGYRNAMHKLPKGMSIAVTIAETERRGDTGANLGRVQSRPIVHGGVPEIRCRPWMRCFGPEPSG